MRVVTGALGGALRGGGSPVGDQAPLQRAQSAGLGMWVDTLPEWPGRPAVGAAQGGVGGDEAGRLRP